jgi:hypothetical protein
MSDAPRSKGSTDKNTQQAENRGQGGTGPPNAQGKAETDKGSEYSCYHETEAKWWHRIDWSQVVLDSLLLIVGIWLACIYSGQLKAMLDSNEINRESLTSVQRAFIVAHDIQPSRNVVRDPTGDRGIWSLNIPMENTGTTPANVTAQAFFTDSLASEPNEAQFAQKPLIQSAVMGPKTIRPIGNVGESDVELLGREFPYRANDIAALPPIQTTIINGGRWHIFWGWVTYRDIFPKTPLHVTEFCQIMGAAILVRDTPQEPFRFGWTPCGHHNCADEQCDDYQRIVEISTKR